MLGHQQLVTLREINMANLIAEKRIVLEQRNYIRKAEPSLDYWFDFSKGVLTDYISKYGNNFNLILYGLPEKDDDFFVLPFDAFNHIFDDRYLANDKRRQKRWIGTIKFNELRVSNCPIKPDISAYYGDASLLGIEGPSPSQLPEEEKNDYAIENRKIEIKARQKQSLFRKRVLTNFSKRCCLSGIGETNLLIASHIVPWAEGKNSRLDPRNGLCLFVLYDGLFDNGYFSLSDDLAVIVTPKIDKLSPQLQQILREIEGRKISKQKACKIRLEYVEYHRNNKLIR
jgi:putative restriction endonuclease